MRALLPFLLATLLSGCVPIPNHRYYAPPISGTILLNGKPVDHASVIVEAKFSSHKESVFSNGNGYFATEPIKELYFTTSLLGDPLYSYQLFITYGEHRYVGYIDSGVGNPAEQVNFSCELSTPIARGTEHFYCTQVYASTQ